MRRDVPATRARWQGRAGRHRSCAVHRPVHSFGTSGTFGRWANCFISETAIMFAALSSLARTGLVALGLRPVRPPVLRWTGRPRIGRPVPRADHRRRAPCGAGRIRSRGAAATPGTTPATGTTPARRMDAAAVGTRADAEASGASGIVATNGGGSTTTASVATIAVRRVYFDLDLTPQRYVQPRYYVEPRHYRANGLSRSHVAWCCRPLSQLPGMGQFVPAPLWSAQAVLLALSLG